MMPLDVFSISKRMLAVAAISSASLFLGSLFVFQANAQSFGQLSAAGAASASTGKVYLSAQAAASATSTPASAESPMLEAHIANNGLVLLRGARILSISGTVIRVDMAWGAAHFTWEVQTNSNTNFFTSIGEKETLADVQPNDIVTVTGILTGGGTEQSVAANFVRG